MCTEVINSLIDPATEVLHSSVGLSNSPEKRPPGVAPAWLPNMPRPPPVPPPNPAPPRPPPNPSPPGLPNTAARGEQNGGRKKWTARIFHRKCIAERGTPSIKYLLQIPCMHCRVLPDRGTRPQPHAQCTDVEQARVGACVRTHIQFHLQGTWFSTELATAHVYLPWLLIRT